MSVSDLRSLLLCRLIPWRASGDARRALQSSARRIPPNTAIINHLRRHGTRLEPCGLLTRLKFWSAKKANRGGFMSERKIAQLIGLTLGAIFACGLVLNAFAF
jgi:hypothetical protein